MKTTTDINTSIEEQYRPPPLGSLGMQALNRPSNPWSRFKYANQSLWRLIVLLNTVVFDSTCAKGGGGINPQKVRDHNETILPPHSLTLKCQTFLQLKYKTKPKKHKSNYFRFISPGKKMTPHPPGTVVWLCRRVTVQNNIMQNAWIRLQLLQTLLYYLLMTDPSYEGKGSDVC